MTTAPLDLRLVPAAAVAWAAGAVVVVLPASHALLAGAVVACVPAVLAVRGLRTRSGIARRVTARGPTVVGAPRRLGQVALSCAVLACVLLAGASQLATRDVGDLGGLATDGRSVTLRGTVTAEPVALRSGPPDAPPRYRATIAVEEVVTADGRRRASAPVTVLSGSPWPHVAHGSEITVDGVLSPAVAGRRAVALLGARGVPRAVGPAPAPLRVVAAMRSGLLRAGSGLGADQRGLVPGIAVGDTSAVPPDLDQALRVSGLAHVTAVSGAHFSIVGAGVLALTAMTGVPRRVRAVVVGAVLAGFVLLVHPGPSVLRAAAMGAVGLGALVLGRPARAVPALAAAVVVLMVVDPWLARELGFVLSVAATSGLVLLAGPLARRWAGSVRAPVAYALAVPVAAQSVCAPIVLVLSPAVALYAVPANVLVAPAVAPATVLGLLAALLAPVWHGGAVVLAELAGAACWWIAWVARTAAGLPGAQVAWTPGVLGVVLLAVATAAGLALALGRRPGDVGHGVGTAPDAAPGWRGTG